MATKNRCFVLVFYPFFGYRPLGAFWLILGSLWAPFGARLPPLALLLAPLWLQLGSLGALLPPIWSLLGSFWWPCGSSWGPLGRFWLNFGLFGFILEAFCSTFVFFKLFWTFFGSHTFFPRPAGGTIAAGKRDRRLDAPGGSYLAI